MVGQAEAGYCWVWVSGPSWAGQAGWGEGPRLLLLVSAVFEVSGSVPEREGPVRVQRMQARATHT